MRHDHRFASLNGAGRKWLTADDLELCAEADSDLKVAADARLAAEAEHDGWRPIVSRGQSLARLGDVFTL